MNENNNILRRLARAVRNQDDPRLINIIEDREKVIEDKDELVRELAAQRDQLISQREELISQREELISQREELSSQRDELGKQISQVTSQKDQLSSQCNEFISQLTSLSNVVLERNRLAQQLAAVVNQEGGSAANLVSYSKSFDDLRARYLDLMESVLTGAVYKDPPLPVFGQERFDPNIRNRGLDWPQNAFSMIGTARMRNLRILTERVIIDNIPGDIVETGVWRGGASILARAVLATYGVRDRRVILADSFEGLPPPDTNQYPADAGSTFHEYPELAVSLDEVRNNFERFGLFDDQVVLLKGWFKDTMPHVPSKQIAILRLDGDMYESTISPLMHLFDRVSAGGWVIIDDYECISACKAAVQDFFSERGLTFEIQQIDGVGVFFMKTA